MDTSCAVARRQRARRPDRLREERASIQAGMDMVASGAARRVVLCGLRFAERLLPDAVSYGTSIGLSIRLDRGPDHPPAIVVASADRAPAN